MRGRELVFETNSTLPTQSENEVKVVMVLSLIYAPNGCGRHWQKWEMKVGYIGLQVLDSMIVSWVLSGLA